MGDSYAQAALRALSAAEVPQRDALRLAKAVLKLQAEKAELHRQLVEIGEGHTAATAQFLQAKREKDQALLELAALRERFGRALADGIAEARVSDQETIAKLELRLGFLRVEPAGESTP